MIPSLSPIPGKYAAAFDARCFQLKTSSNFFFFFNAYMISYILIPFFLIYLFLFLLCPT